MTTPTIGPIDAAESKPAYFLFANEVPSNATIADASVSAALLEGTDANPAGIITGDVTIDNTSKVVSQKLTPAGRTGNRYKLRCVATDSLGNIHVVAAEIAVVSL